MNVAPQQAVEEQRPPAAGHGRRDPHLYMLRPPTPAPEHAPAPSPGHPPAGGAAGSPRAAGQAPREEPSPHESRDGILPAVAAALSVRGETWTGTGSKAAEPPTPHPLVQDFLDALPTERRERHTGRCAEAVLLSRFLAATEAARAGKRAGRKPLSDGDARKALKNARITARHIREEGDPRHGGYAPPCLSCAALLEHFGVRSVDPGADSGVRETS